MSKLNIDQKTIKDLFQAKQSDFLIPDYQRPYAWTETECQTLWDDVFAFAIPDEGRTEFDADSEYFLGPIVTFKNHQDGRMEVIDGQQRLTTLMLLLRAFYDFFERSQTPASVRTRENIEKCLWKTDEFGAPDKKKLKIDSEVATDKDKDEFLLILRTGKVDSSMKSQYALNFNFFRKKIEDFSHGYIDLFPFLPTRIMNNCILLPIEAESQDTALRIFSTLNDRGKPLSDSDIFKAQFYKYFTAIGKKDEFIRKWKALEELTAKIFHPIAGTPMDELFTRYMYYERAKLGIKSSTTEGLRKFYEKNAYSILNKEETFYNLIDLADFWLDVSNQDPERFSTEALRRLFVLNYAPNGMWNYIVSVYYLQNRDENNLLDDEKFVTFLNRITAFVWTYAVTNPGVNALRTPFFAEMVNIVNNIEVTFGEFKFDLGMVETAFNNYVFSNNRQITKSMLTWWAFTDASQEILPLETSLEIEHIYAKKRHEVEDKLKNSKNLEALGNKSLLEKKINIRASDYKFEDKKRYYLGYENSRKQWRNGTRITELVNFANTRTDFAEADIIARTDEIISAFLRYIAANNLAV